MLIEEYFRHIGQTIEESCSIINSQLVNDKRSLYIGFIEGKLIFLNGSSLRFMEFVNLKAETKRYKYSYHYQDSDDKLVFRYDMAPHHQEVRTFPHHKHTATGDIIESTAPSLAEVLEEIEDFSE
ncbi:MAG: DUF6516 family protein [Candidatus Electrothrix aestuarii]|uniref:DUF6516 family protein n=1 Tax=Candidatus Electrothrix aestuarii TaxID=3062594 RepID=A0AAU8LRT2_9BACT|nr:DUF6516 family protein [Candidatus Electrothrix aestuarii]